MQKQEEAQWKFPDLTYLAGDKLKNDGHNTELILQAEQINNLLQQLESKEIKIDDLKQELAQLHKHIEDLNESREQLFIKFQDAIQTSLQRIREDGLCLVKKMTRLIINRELSMDDSLLKEILDHLLTKMNNDSSITVEVSIFDFAALSKLPYAKPVTLIENMNLKAGDIVIKNHQQGLVFDIDAAINEMLGL